MEGWNVNQKKSRATTTTNLPFEMSWILKLLNVVVISDDNLICFMFKYLQNKTIFKSRNFLPYLVLPN